MTDLFDQHSKPNARSTIGVEGLSCVQDFIAKEEEERLLEAIDGETWSTELKRRVQHYGYRYDYKARTVSQESYLGPLPDWVHFLVDKLNENEIFSAPPDQAIVNEYQPGQGIAPHIDCVPCFTNTIASLSLGSACQMAFSKKSPKKQMSVLLSRRSLLVLQGEARYKWRHSIAARKSDIIDGVRTSRERRVSITFRKALAPDAR